MTPVALSIEEALPKKMRNYVAGMCVRTALVLSTVVVALSFPYFGTCHLLLFFPHNSSSLNLPKNVMHSNAMAFSI